MMRLLSRLLALATVLPCVGCHWIAGNPDATLNGAVQWHDAAPTPVAPNTDLGQTIWVRVRTREVLGNSVRVLSSRVRQRLREWGWQVVEERDDAAVWLDLDIRYWGVNPVRDEAASTYAKVLHARPPGLIDEAEQPRGGRFGSRSLLTPGAALVSALTANVVEYDFIVDLHVAQQNRERSQEKQTLVVWVRKIDLDEQEAANEVSTRALQALRGVFGAG